MINNGINNVVIWDSKWTGGKQRAQEGGEVCYQSGGYLQCGTAPLGPPYLLDVPWNKYMEQCIGNQPLHRFKIYLSWTCLLENMHYLVQWNSQPSWDCHLMWQYQAALGCSWHFKSIQTLQLAQNAAMQTSLEALRVAHVTPLLCKLHWFPVSFWVYSRYRLSPLNSTWHRGRLFWDYLSLRISAHFIKLDWTDMIQVPSFKCL